MEERHRGPFIGSLRRFLLWRKRLKAIRDTQSFLRAEAPAEALRWMKEHAQDLDAEERAFIEQSRRAVRNRRLGEQMAAALALVLTASAARMCMTVSTKLN